jgi:pyrimidine-specific ribonucleoside hydrolase
MGKARFTTPCLTMTTQKIPVILDCDPGHDDAIMLMLAFGSGRFDVKAVTASAGNQTQEKTLRNALNILSLIGANVPVHRGCDKPMFRDLIIADHVHGATGLDGPEFPPEPALKPHPVPAVQAIADILANSPEKITIVPTGPLTNIAVFLLAYPHLKSKIERISLMGGGISRGNITPAAEFNIFVDPEAAAVVFESGVPITMCGLDVTHKALVFEEDIQRFRDMGNQTGKVTAALMDFFSIYYRQERPELNGGAALHDPCALACLIHPEMFHGKDCFVRIETQGQYTTGSTDVDFFNALKQPPNAHVIYDIDREAFMKLLYNSLKTLP